MHLPPPSKVVTSYFPLDHTPSTPAGIFNFWQGLFSPKKSPVVGQLIVVDHAVAQEPVSREDFIADLQQFKATCAQRSTILAQQSRLKKEMANDYLAKVGVLDEQIACLLEIGNTEELVYDNPEKIRLEILLKTYELQQEQRNWSAEATSCLNEAHLIAKIANSYSRFVIELQMSIYQVLHLSAAEGQIEAKQLLLDFQERCRRLEAQLQEPDQLPSQLPPPTSTAAKSE